MPNWCKGNIRFRGKLENIIQLILNEFESPNGSAEIVYSKEYGQIKGVSKKEKSYPGWEFYIKGTRRCFVDAFDTYLPEPSNPEKEVVFCLDGLNAAWSIQDNGFMELVKKYNVDIKIVGFEQGMMFHQVVAFYRDGSRKEEIKEYKPDEWYWECFMPNFGG